LLLLRARPTACWQPVMVPIPLTLASNWVSAEPVQLLGASALQTRKLPPVGVRHANRQLTQTG
jgi:hypothetical protein